MAVLPALPPQSAAPLSAPPGPAKASATSLLFNKTWWLYFQQLLEYVSGLPTSIPAPTPGSGAQVFDFALTANLTLTAANTSDPTLLAAGSLMAVFLRQDSTGGWTTTWNSPPFRGGPGGLGVLKNTWSLVMFINQVDPADSVLKWWRTSLITNQT